MIPTVTAMVGLRAAKLDVGGRRGVGAGPSGAGAPMQNNATCCTASIAAAVPMCRSVKIYERVVAAVAGN
jgi:hypothetical protein